MLGFFVFCFFSRFVFLFVLIELHQNIKEFTVNCKGNETFHIFMKLNVAFNVSFRIFLIYYACFYFLFFICAILTTSTKADEKTRK